METTTIIPHIKPMARAPQALTAPHPAVIPTKPAKAPFRVMEISALPYLIQVRNNATTAPAAAARFVVITIPATLFALSPDIASSDPGLKPNHPNQRIKTPSAP